MSKINLKIDGKEISVAENTTVLDAASQIDIDIPNLCYFPGKDPFTSCMVCMVKDDLNDKLLPACSARVEDGMEVITDSEDVIEARKTALELLLSEHLGDCEAQCRMICPAYMNIPVMIRHIQEGNADLALKTIRENIPLSKTISLICPAPCEKGCRRKRHDRFVSIKNLERYAAFHDQPEKPKIPPENGKKVAIVGSGPAGISVAYFLLLKGYKCVVIEKENQLGGVLREIAKDILPSEVLDEEIEFIRTMGCEFRTEEEVDHSDLKKLEGLKKDFDAVVLTTGDKGKISDDFKVPDWLFATSENKSAIKAIGDGRIISREVETFLISDNNQSEPINSRFGALQEGDMEQFMKIASDIDILEPENSKTGYSKDEAQKEAERCLHCDCGKTDNCKLRDLSTEYNADQKNYQEIKKDNKRAKNFIRDIDGDVIYEPGKCIKCGICVRICADIAEKQGMAFTGRGYNTEVQIPFGAPLLEGLGKAADECVDKCPTGALVKVKN